MIDYLLQPITYVFGINYLYVILIILIILLISNLKRKGRKQ